MIRNNFKIKMIRKSPPIPSLLESLSINPLCETLSLYNTCVLVDSPQPFELLGILNVNAS